MSFTREDLRGADVVWLLSVTWAGRDYRFSSRPVAPVNADGLALPHDGGLDDVAWEDNLEILAPAPEIRSASITVVFGIDVAARIAEGHDLSAAEGEIALWIVGTPYESREVIIHGHVVAPEYGAADEAVNFALEEDANDDTKLIPASAAVVTTSTWDQSVVQTPSESLGRYYPDVYGQPGLWTDAGGEQHLGRGSPCVVVDYANLSGQAQILVLAGHPVEASTVCIVDQDGDTYVATVMHREDNLGRMVATVEIPLTGSGIDSTGTLWCCWAFGRARCGIHGAGDLLTHMLQRSGLRVDWSRMEALREPLNGIFQDPSGYIDDACSPWEWVQEHLVPMIPVAFTSGPQGIYPVMLRYDATATDAVATLRQGAGVVRTSRITYERTRRDVVNEIRISYAIDGEDGAVGVCTLTAEPTPGEPSQVSSYHAKISASRYGVRSRQVECDLIWTSSSARALAARIALAEGLTQRAVTYEVDAEDWGWLHTGQVLMLIDLEVSMDSVLCLLRSRTYTDGGRISLGLLVLEDPARDAPGPRRTA